MIRTALQHSQHSNAWLRSPAAFLLPALLALASCGVDGEPQPPASNSPGVSVSGEMSAGVTGQL